MLPSNPNILSFAHCSELAQLYATRSCDYEVFLCLCFAVQRPEFLDTIWVSVKGGGANSGLCTSERLLRKEMANQTRRVQACPPRRNTIWLTASYPDFIIWQGLDHQTTGNPGRCILFIQIKSCSQFSFTTLEARYYIHNLENGIDEIVTCTSSPDFYKGDYFDFIRSNIKTSCCSEALRFQLRGCPISLCCVGQIRRKAISSSIPFPSRPSSPVKLHEHSRSEKG